MSKWFTTPATTPHFTEPETIFVRFIDENYRGWYTPEVRSNLKFLELGSGSGGDLKFLERNGFDALGIDSSEFAYAQYHCDFSEFPWKDFNGWFDCIYELNVLCAVEDPPYRQISQALKPGGKFFAIMPATNTEADFSGLEERGISVRTSEQMDIVAALNGLFSKIYVAPYWYSHRRRLHRNWTVEADK